ncbi:hypothetical protein RND61_08760 [Streptomyces sp. TRM76323]|uniref:Integral membrane protein n=1 Tax=Streptomyces tamarix TaxID=3078565 RepID=A0ABU3QHB7_9ACTN|nr:hypothetical protein [Streptomyces tamarix]MDT9682163.1 hypothetical protein [Streptomyces tamarix]
MTLAGPGPALRLVRAAVFAAVCVLTAALGHSLASGSPLPLGFLAGAMAVTTAAAWWLARVERGALQITATTVGAQLALHSFFSFAPAPGGGHHQHHRAVALPQSACMGGATDPVAQAVWQAHTGTVPPAPPGPESPVAYVVQLITHGSWTMFFAHVLAALVCGLWMWRGEAAVFAIARSLHCAFFEPLRLVLAGLPPARPLSVPRGAPVAVHPRRLRDLLLRHAMSRRGPPWGHPVPC